MVAPRSATMTLRTTLDVLLELHGSAGVQKRAFYNYLRSPLRAFTQHTVKILFHHIAENILFCISHSSWWPFCISHSSWWPFCISHSSWWPFCISHSTYIFLEITHVTPYFFNHGWIRIGKVTRIIHDNPVVLNIRTVPIRQRSPRSGYGRATDCQGPNTDCHGNSRIDPGRSGARSGSVWLRR